MTQGLARQGQGLELTAKSNIRFFSSVSKFGLGKGIDGCPLVV
jgi:hypothetical protein